MFKTLEGFIFKLNMRSIPPIFSFNDETPKPHQTPQTS